MEKCPVCETTLVSDYGSSMEDGTIEEAEEHCPRCRYWYGYAYGDTVVCIGEQSWQFGYNESPERRRVRAEIAQAIEDAKRQRGTEPPPRSEEDVRCT